MLHSWCIGFETEFHLPHPQLHRWGRVRVIASRPVDATFLSTSKKDDVLQLLEHPTSYEGMEAIRLRGRGLRLWIGVALLHVVRGRLGIIAPPRIIFPGGLKR